MPARGPGDLRRGTTSARLLTPTAMSETTPLTHWTLDPVHSHVQFRVKHLVISHVTGSFKTLRGAMESTGDAFEHAQVTFALDVDSIDTNSDLRDSHLRGDIFFNAATFPHITFFSTAFAKEGAGAYQLTGNLTMMDVTKPVTLAVTHGGQAVDMYGNHRAGFEASATLNRKEFGLSWGGLTEAGTIVMGDEVKLSINVQFIKQR